MSDNLKIIELQKKKNKKVNSKIMNQLSYEVSTQKIDKLGFKFKDDIKKIISEELKHFDNLNTI